MRADLEAIGRQYAAETRQHRPRVFVEIGDHPLVTAGAGSFLDDLIARAGGVNVAHEIRQGYPIVNPEKVIQWNPDVIVLTSMGRGGDAQSRLAERIGWANISAVKFGRIVHDLDPDLLFRPGPRLVDGTKALAARLYPKALPKSVTGTQ